MNIFDRKYYKKNIVASDFALGLIVCLLSIALALFITFYTVSRQKTITLNVSETSYVNDRVVDSKDKGFVDIPVAVAYVWPIVFFAGGIVFMSDVFKSKKVRNMIFTGGFGTFVLFLSLVFLLYIEMSWSISLVVYLFLGIGLLIYINFFLIAIKYIKKSKLFHS